MTNRGNVSLNYTTITLANWPRCLIIVIYSSRGFLSFGGEAGGCVPSHLPVKSVVAVHKKFRCRFSRPLSE